MNFEGEFRKLAECDISALIQYVSDMPEESWYGTSIRHKAYPMHKHTQSIRFLYDRDFRHTDPTVHPEYDDFKSLIKPCLVGIKRYFDSQLKYQRLQKKHGKGYFIRLVLTRLNSGGAIQKHFDNGFSLLCSHRIHMPVITNDEVHFTVGESVKALKSGELWEINNRLLHGVENSSDLNRVHLIMDYVLPGEKIIDTSGEQLIC